MAGAMGRVNGGRVRELGLGAGLGMTMGVGQLTDVAWGGGPIWRRAAEKGDSLLPQGRVSHWRKGLRGFPLPQDPAIRAPSRGGAASCSAPSRPVGGEGGGVRWCPPPLRLLLPP